MVRLPVGALVLAPLLVLGTACSGGGDGGGDSATDDRSSGATTAPVLPDSSAPEPGSPIDPTACDEVVAGIAAFNAGDFEGTVWHFEAAVPLAESEAKVDPGRAADDLLEAVRYYADLAPEAYQEASLSSPDFAKYKEITLGQCASDAPTEAPSDNGGGVLA